MKFINRIKNLLLITVFVIFTQHSYSQMRRGSSPFSISFGVNLIDNNGDRNPFSIINEPEVIAFNTPFELIFGYELSSKFEITAGLSINKFKEGHIIDSFRIEEDFSYFAVDLSVRYYVYDYEINRISNIRLYTNAGLGIYNIKSSQVTGNIGFGAIYNVSDRVGFYAGSTAKFSLDNKVFSSNLFQHNIGVRLKLFRACSCSLF